MLPLAVLHALPFAMRPAIIGGDEPHYALASHSLALDRDLELEDDYRAVSDGSAAAGRKRAGHDLDRHLLEVGGGMVFAHPLGLPVLLAPLVWIQQRLAPGSAPDAVLCGATLTVTFLALVVGWSLCQRWAGEVRLGALVALGLYFSTPLWFYSRTLFPEPFIWSFMVFAVAGVARRRWLAAGCALGLAFLMKESALLLVVPIVLVTARRYGVRHGAVLAIGPMVAAALFVSKNVLVYGAPLVTFQPFQLGSPLRGLAGLLLDPRHGVVLFAPLLVIASAGWSIGSSRSSRWSSEATFSLAICVVFLALTASWIDWRGGSCYGPRLLVPIMPLFAVPLMRLWRSGGLRLRRGVLAATLLGFVIQWCAALHPFDAFWSISVGRLVTMDPLATLSGIAVGGWLLWRHGPPVTDTF